jgi:hypothetical protein
MLANVLPALVAPAALAAAEPDDAEVARLRRLEKWAARR